MFCASEEQVEIRRKARGLYDSGICLIGEWCRKIPALTVQKWKLWERTDGFMDWWTELFPEHGGVTISDLRALEFEANRSLMRGLLEGDMAATKMVIQMVSNAKDAQNISDKSMDEWFSSPEENNGWTQEWN